MNSMVESSLSCAHFESIRQSIAFEPEVEKYNPVIKLSLSNSSTLINNIIVMNLFFHRGMYLHFTQNFLNIKYGST